MNKRKKTGANALSSDVKQGDSVASLLAEVKTLIAVARNAVVSTVNTLQVLTNFEIGRRIFEHEQKGAKRAEYGAELLKELSAKLTEEFGKGFSVTNLKLMRQFFLDFNPRIGQQPTDQFRIQQHPPVELPADTKGQLVADRSAIVHIATQQPDRKSPFTLSWTHYVLLLTIKNHDERSFYEIEATQQGWSVPELKRQKASALYERLALSRDKDGIRKLAHQDLGQMQMYVNYFDRHVKLPDENPTVGLLLCQSKKDAIVELTLPKGANIHAREYQLYLPSNELLKKKLLEWTQKEESCK